MLLDWKISSPGWIALTIHLPHHSNRFCGTYLPLGQSKQFPSVAGCLKLLSSVWRIILHQDLKFYFLPFKGKGPGKKRPSTQTTTLISRLFYSDLTKICVFCRLIVYNWFIPHIKNAMSKFSKSVVWEFNL